MREIAQHTKALQDEDKMSVKDYAQEIFAQIRRLATAEERNLYPFTEWRDSLFNYAYYPTTRERTLQADIFAAVQKLDSTIRAKACDEGPCTCMGYGMGGVNGDECYQPHPAFWWFRWD